MRWGFETLRDFRWRHDVYSNQASVGGPVTAVSLRADALALGQVTLHPQLAHALCQNGVFHHLHDGLSLAPKLGAIRSRVRMFSELQSSKLHHVESIDTRLDPDASKTRIDSLQKNICGHLRTRPSWKRKCDVFKSPLINCGWSHIEYAGLHFARCEGKIPLVAEKDVSDCQEA
eukprot:4325869-Amphidinium_carterae.1